VNGNWAVADNLSPPTVPGPTNAVASGSLIRFIDPDTAQYPI
jgi:hypothetical protein